MSTPEGCVPPSAFLNPSTGMSNQEAVEFLDELLWLTANTAPGKASRILLTEDLRDRMKHIRDGLAAESDA